MPLSLAPSLALPAFGSVPLCNPAAWIGFWDFEDGNASSSNRVTTSPGQLAVGGVTSGTYARYGSHGKGDPTGMTVSVGTITGSPTVGSFTIGAFRRSAAFGATPPRITLGAGITLYQGGASYAHVIHSSSFLTTAANLVPTDTTWRFYAMTYDANSGAWAIYRDDTLFESGSIAAGLSSSASTFACLFNGGSDNAVDNMFATREVLSAQALSAIRAGVRPGATGLM